MRDLHRHLKDIPEGGPPDRIIASLALVLQLQHQQPNGSDKTHALHEPEVDCISKGKARVRCEFGCKVSVATTLDEEFVVRMRLCGQSLRRRYLERGPRAGENPDRPAARSGCRRPELLWPGEDKTRILISGARRGLTPKLIADLRRRSAIEAETGHVKTDSRLTKGPVSGKIGAALFAAICVCGHNIGKILAHLRPWRGWLIAALSAAPVTQNSQHQAIAMACLHCSE